MLFVLPGLQSGQQPIDGANAVLADPLLDKMVGHWIEVEPGDLTPGLSALPFCRISPYEGLRVGHEEQQRIYGEDAELTKR